MRKLTGGFGGLFGVAARIVIPVLTMALLASEAQAQCAPASANNITATCSGTTTNQGAGAPGTSAGTSGYGGGTETGITVNVDASGTVTGNVDGIFVGAGTVTNGSGATITGGTDGINANTGAIVVTNSGAITGTADVGIAAATDATVTNNAGATITGNTIGIFAAAGAANVTNSGAITGTTDFGITGFTSATVTNNAGGSITGLDSGIGAGGGPVTVVNSGSIIGTNTDGIIANTDATVTNNAGGSITGGVDGVLASNGAATVVNSGSIVGTSTDGIQANTNATVTNNAGGSIKGGEFGIISNGGAVNVTNSGSITGTTEFGVQAGTSATVTNNAGGSITGAVFGIHASGAGSSVFNAGAISGGTDAIEFTGAGNTLTLGPGSVITGNVIGGAAATFQLGGVGAATFDVSQIGAAAQYQDFSTFNKVGSSTWTLTGSNAPLAWTVQQGTLNVSGTIGAVTVTGGTLMGAGVVGDTTVASGGAFAPGSGAAGSSLTVAGSLKLQSGAHYQVQLNPTTSSFANVTGVATPGGATVNATYSGSGTILKQYTILTAGSVSGTFNPAVTTNLPNFFATLSYDPTDAFLNLTLRFTSASGSGLNVNQQNVANALSGFFNATGGIPAALGMLSPAGLTQASGELATGSQQTTFDAMNMFLGVLTDPTISGRGDDMCGPSSDPAPGKTASPIVPCYDRWSAWGAGFGGSRNTDGDGALGSNNATSSVYGAAVGADYHISPFTVAGFALGGGGTNFSVSNSGSGHSDLFQAGAYIRHNFGPAYVTAALAYGWQDITTNRTIGGADPLQAKFDGNAFSGRLESGYRFDTPWMGVTPYGAAQFTTFDLPSYSESGLSGANPFALSYSSKDVTDFRTELGFRADKSFPVQDGVMTLGGRLAWAHDYDPDRTMDATFEALQGASFIVNGATQARDAALTSASFEMKWRNGWSAGASFEGEFSGISSAYAGKGVVRYSW
jgi:uncharacterized protein with beta-barrel porin domain